MKTKLFLLLALLAPALALADSSSSVPKSKAILPAESAYPVPIPDYDGTVEAFKSTYKTLGRPRLAVYVNRSLVRDRGEMTEWTSTNTRIKTKGDPVPLPNQVNVQIGADNKSTVAQPQVSGKGGEADQSTGVSTRVLDENEMRGVRPVTAEEAREIEEVFQKPFFEAGAKFTDQKIAELAQRAFRDPDANFLTAPADDKERREVESLRKSADLAVEILARKKSVVIAQTSGADQTEERLSLTVTVISLKDGVKLAQVSTDSLYKFNRRYGKMRERQARQVTSADMIEQAALATMQRLAP